MSDPKNNSSEANLPPVPNQKIEEAAKREEARLNSLLLKNKECLRECIASGITHHYFQIDSQKELFAIIARYWDKYQAMLTRQAFESIVAQSFPDEKAAKLRNGFDATFSEIVSEDDFGILKANIEGRFMQRKAFGTIQKHYDILLNSTSGQKAIVEKLQNEINEIKSLNANSFNMVASLGEMLETKVMEEIRDRRDHPEKYWGVMTGFKCMDDVYHGLGKGRYGVFLAMEGGGKTTLMFNIARNMTVKSGYNIVYVTIESNAKDTSTRLLTIHAAVNYNRIIAGGKDTEKGLSPFIVEELEKAAKDLATSGAGDRFHWIQVLQGTTAKEILALVNRKRAYQDIDVLFLDYLDVVGRHTSHDGRPDLDLAAVSDTFQSWGRENNILVLTAQQMTRDKVKKMYDQVSSSSDLRVGTADIAGSKKISGAADYMFSILIDQETRDRVWIWSTKARQGVSATRWCISYDPNSGRMDDMPDDGNYAEFQDEVRRKVREKTKTKPRKFKKKQEDEDDEEEYDSPTKSKVTSRPPSTRVLQEVKDASTSPEEPSREAETFLMSPKDQKPREGSCEESKEIKSELGISSTERPVMDEGFAEDDGLEMF